MKKMNKKYIEPSPLTDTKAMSFETLPPPILSFDKVETRQDLNRLVDWVVELTEESLSENWYLCKGENMLLGAILFLIWNTAPGREHTLGVAQIFLSKMQASLIKEETTCAVDILFDKWRDEKWNIVAVHDWENIRELELATQLVIVERLQTRIEAIKKYIDDRVER